MRNLLIFSLLATLGFGLMGCAGPVIDQAPTAVGLFANMKGAHPNVELMSGEPRQVAGFAKSGQARATSILGYVNVGDASLQAAAENAGLEKIQHANLEKTGILNIYAQKTVTVYGQ